MSSRNSQRRVSAVRPHKRNPDRVEVDFGDDMVVITPEYLVRAGIRVGRELADAELVELETESLVVQAMDRAIVLLSHRARATVELRRRLTKLEYPTFAIDEALERLTRLGYLDDASFARQLARGRMLASGQSRFRIRSELLRKGVDRDTAEEAIDETLATEDVDERSIIERVAAKKAKSLARLDPQTRRRRLYAFLARRGFAIDDINRVVSRQMDPGDETP